MIRVGFILVFVYKSEDKPYRKRKCHCTCKSMKIQNKSKDYRSKKIIREKFIRVPRCYQCFIFLTCGHRRRLMDTMLSQRSFLLTWYPQPSAWTKFKHGGHGGHGSGLSLISYVSNGYWCLLRIWECWGTPYSLACTSDEDFKFRQRVYKINSWHFAYHICLYYCYCLFRMLTFTPTHPLSPDPYTTIRPSRTAFGNKEAKYSSLFGCYYLMFALAFTILLISKTHFFHSTKL